MKHDADTSATSTGTVTATRYYTFGGATVAIRANDGQLAPEDRTYLAQLVAQRTNMSQADAQARVDQVYGQAKQAVADAKLKAQQAADAAAKVAAMSALWTFVALLCGAFVASLAAIWGGRRRDAVTYFDTRTYTNTSSIR